jgi:hypothetical protein
MNCGSLSLSEMEGRMSDLSHEEAKSRYLHGRRTLAALFPEQAFMANQAPYRCFINCGLRIST